MAALRGEDSLEAEAALQSVCRLLSFAENYVDAMIEKARNG
jgi:hypothetical protein